MRARPVIRAATSLAVSVALFGAAAVARAESEAFQQERTAIVHGDYAAAEKVLSVVNGGSDRAKALIEVARIQLLSGRYADAIATTKKLVPLGQDAKNEAAALRGDAFARQGKMSEALAALREVETEEGARRARVELGELLIRTGHRAEARVPLLTLTQDYNDDKIALSDAEGLTLVGRAAPCCEALRTRTRRTTLPRRQEAERMSRHFFGARTCSLRSTTPDTRGR